ncbi:hybrid sensor histidine kinase/response regulator [Massilia arenosa]|uniref:histidine kinase n=1 Tax=Zemynaea arenosa TaxID=2561931 RepID=A0A4Y9S4A4_9BURK|nr:hybrid sensor histidine kinase/response regulator [Massilia arenosa]TFW16167.1 hybrid sensor histidine kinase/response regulator [Massilia arenosa]
MVTDSAPPTVLYVDDEEMARKYFARSAGEAFHVLTAASVADAAELLADPEHEIRVVVCDYRMPGANGTELLRRISLSHPHIVRIVLTAYADKDMLIEAVNSGEVWRILEKPLDQPTLRRTLQLAAQRARARMARRESFIAIEETLAFLAHELTTPLATISNFARGLRRRADSGGMPPGELANVATTMHDNARYSMGVLSSFVDSVRRAKSAPPGRSGEHTTTGANLVHALVDAYPLTPGQRAGISVEVRGDFPVTALPHCVSLVLSSLLGNALRALADQPNPQLRFIVDAQPEPSIVISDNGPGIPAEVMERLLIDPVSAHADKGGTGWGMIFCNRVMQSFGGRICVHSEQGRSTTIALHFPVLEKD